MGWKIKFNTRHKRTRKEIGICTNKRNKIIFICTTTYVKLEYIYKTTYIKLLHACNIFAVVDILRYIYKISLYLYYCNWRRLSNLHNSRNFLQKTFVGDIMSKMLKWILEPLKSLICSEDTKNSYTTIY